MTRFWFRASLVVGMLMLGATGSFVCQRVAQRGRFVGAYSSHGSGPKGTRALYLLVERLGIEARRWSQDLSGLPEGAMLVAAGGCEVAMTRPLSRYEQQELLRWVTAGGVLVVAGARDYLPDGLGVRFESEPHCGGAYRFLKTSEEGHESGSKPTRDAGVEPGAESDAPGTDQSDGVVEYEGDDLDESFDPDAALAGSDTDRAAGLVWAAPEGELLRGLESVGMRRPGWLVVDDDAHSELLLSAPDAPDMPASPVRRSLGVIVSHGAGRVIVLASGSMWQNGSLVASDGALLFARLAEHFVPDGPVIFDEYHLGMGERRSMMRYLRQRGATPIALQLLFLSLLLLWRGGARFGGIEQQPEPAPRGTASFVSAMGHLFERARDPAGALDILTRRALSRVARYHHVPVSGPRALAQRLRERGRGDAAQAVEELARASQALTSERGGLVAATRGIDAAVARACREGSAAHRTEA